MSTSQWAENSRKNRFIRLSAAKSLFGPRVAEKRVKKYSAELPQEPSYRPRNGLKIREKIDFFGSLPPDRYLNRVWPRKQ